MVADTGTKVTADTIERYEYVARGLRACSADYKSLSTADKERLLSLSQELDQLKELPGMDKLATIVIPQTVYHNISIARKEASSGKIGSSSGSTSTKNFVEMQEFYTQQQLMRLSIEQREYLIQREIVHEIFAKGGHEAVESALREGRVDRNAVSTEIIVSKPSTFKAWLEAGGNVDEARPDGSTVATDTANIVENNVRAMRELVEDLERTNEVDKKYYVEFVKNYNSFKTSDERRKFLQHLLDGKDGNAVKIIKALGFDVDKEGHLQADDAQLDQDIKTVKISYDRNLYPDAKVTTGENQGSNATVVDAKGDETRVESNETENPKTAAEKQIWHWLRSGEAYDQLSSSKEQFKKVYNPIDHEVTEKVGNLTTSRKTGESIKNNSYQEQILRKYGAKFGHAFASVEAGVAAAKYGRCVEVQNICNDDAIKGAAVPGASHFIKAVNEENPTNIADSTFTPTQLKFANRTGNYSPYKIHDGITLTGEKSLNRYVADLEAQKKYLSKNESVAYETKVPAGDFPVQNTDLVTNEQKKAESTKEGEKHVVVVPEMAFARKSEASDSFDVENVTSSETKQKATTTGVTQPASAQSAETKADVSAENIDSRAQSQDTKGFSKFLDKSLTGTAQSFSQKDEDNSKSAATEQAVADLSLEDFTGKIDREKEGKANVSGQLANNAGKVSQDSVAENTAVRAEENTR